MKKINKLLVAIIIAISHHGTCATAPGNGCGTGTPWFGVNGDGRLVNVSNQARARLPECGRKALVTVQDEILDLFALPATSMRGLWDPENFESSEQSASDEIRAFFNDRTQRITLLAPQALERIEHTMPCMPYDRLRWGPAIAFVDLSGCSALKTIGYQAFCNIGLEAIMFPACLEEIQSLALLECHNLKRIDLSHCTHLKKIGDGAFGDCSSLEKLILPPALEVFGENAISGCTNLRYLTLGKLSPLASASPFDPWWMNWGSARYPCFSEVRFLGMDTSSLHPHWALAITPRNWLESFLAQLPTILDLMFVNLTPADLAKWRTDLTPKLRTFAGSPGYQALLEMPDQTIARAWFRGRLLSIFNESFRKVLGKEVLRRTYASADDLKIKSTERKYFRELKKSLSRVPFSPPTVFSETTGFWGDETRPLSPP
ncbi:MAG: leucine-rich repeat domain-containing protein [Holosporales bacterium]|jgi:hypothetical protein|nr:leucine-rich repeat domain-containing protein [Holosporales bacterium]